MEWLAEFMGWRWDGRSMVDAEKFKRRSMYNWNDWMLEVEPKIRERGLAEQYASELYEIVETELYELEPDDRMELDTAVIFARLDQHIEALRRVLE